MLRYLRRTTLVIADLFAFMISAMLALAILKPLYIENSTYQFIQLSGIYALSIIIVLMIFAYRGHYSWRTPWWEQVKHVGTLCFFMLLITVLINYVAIPLLPSQPLLLLIWALAIPTILLFRLIGRMFLKKLNHWNIKTVLVGNTQNIIDTIIALKSEFYLTYDINHVVLLESDSHIFKNTYPDIAIKNNLDDVKSHSMVILCLDENNQSVMLNFVTQIKKIGAKFAIVPPTSGFSFYGLKPQYFFGYNIVLMESQYRLRTFWGRLIKNTMDRCMALTALILLAPVFGLLMIKVRQDGGPAFYFQNRIGKDGKPFKCWKFRSMVTNSAEMLKEILEKDSIAREEYARDFKLKNDPRITKIGHFLRKSSLDEIPQLWNVLKGEMSIVGPRPIVKAEEAFYGDKFNHYLSVRPGITGLWQVSGRNDVTYDQRVALDTWYVENWSIWNDLVIVFKTSFVVLYRKGAY